MLYIGTVLAVTVTRRLVAAQRREQVTSKLNRYGGMNYGVCCTSQLQGREAQGAELLLSRPLVDSANAGGAASSRL